MKKNIGVKNLATVTTALQKYGKVIEQGVKDEIQKATDNIDFEASTNKPSSAIVITKEFSNSGLTGVVVASHQFDDRLSAFYEFGTGIYAAELVPTYPREVQELARSYFVNGQGRLPSKPYLIPAFLKQRKIFLMNIKKLVKDKTK